MGSGKAHRHLCWPRTGPGLSLYGSYCCLAVPWLVCVRCTRDWVARLVVLRWGKGATYGGRCSTRRIALLLLRRGTYPACVNYYSSLPY